MMKIFKKQIFKRKSYFTLILSISIPLLVGFLGSLFTTPKINTWYAGLSKPPFNPPNWIFGPVWTLLFILMGISLYLIWSFEFSSKNAQKRLKFHLTKKIALSIYFIQIVFNVLWSVFFFGFESPLLGGVVIVFLLGLIGTNIFYFFKLRPLAAYLLIPYILWVGFATILNFSILALN